MMYTNADCTVYNRQLDRKNRRDTWVRTQIRGVFWDGSHAHRHGDKGDITANNVTVYIPADACDKHYKPPKDYASDPSGAYTLAPGDLIIRGLIREDIDANTTVAALLQKYDDAYTILSCEDNRYGSSDLQHFCVKG